ncbi:hypothetical protein Tco_0523038 [Tanacetum coccineum]
MLMNFETRSSHVSIDEGVSFPATIRLPLERKREKHKFNRRIWYVRNLHRRSDLVEITDVSMWVFFIISKKLLVLDKIQKTMLDLKVIRGGLSVLKIGDSQKFVGLVVVETSTAENECACTK